MGRGLGGIIITSQRRGPREHIYLVLVAIVAVAFLTDKLWALVGRFLFPYREVKTVSDARPRSSSSRASPRRSTPARRARFTALKDVSFRIDDIPDYGEFIAIVGPSGCGKSTILNLIQGFSDVYPPSAGEVLVRGPQGRRARARSRDDLPEVQLVPAPHRARERDLRPRAEPGRAAAHAVGERDAQAARVDPEGRALGPRAASTRTSSRAASSSAWPSRARSC